MIRHREKYAELNTIFELPAVQPYRLHQHCTFIEEFAYEETTLPIADWLESIITSIPNHPTISTYMSKWVKSAQSVEIYHHSSRAFSIMYAEYGLQTQIIFVKLGNYHYEYNISFDYFFESTKPHQRISRATIKRLITTYLYKHFV